MPLLSQKSGFFSRLIPVAAAVFFAALPVAVGSGISSALRPGTAFTRAWEKENLEGDFSEAAEEYERLYRGSGLPPSAEVVLKFLADQRGTRAKRNELIDRLIGSEEYIDRWANKWADLLQVNRKFLGAEGAKSFRDWIRNEVKTNTPYNEFARKILTASGSNKTNPAASYYKILRKPDAIMENTTHLWLATRFNCNKCHDHPFERWTQDQYYETAAFFAQVGRKTGEDNRETIIYNRRSGGVRHIVGNRDMPPKFLGANGPEIAKDANGKMRSGFPLKSGEDRRIADTNSLQWKPSRPVDE